MQKFNSILVVLAAVMAVLITCTDTFGATPEGNPEPKTMVFKKGDVFLLSEFGGVVKLENGNAVLEFIMPEDKRSKEYQKVDLENGDVILMINGKKIRSIEDLENNYDLVTVGDNIKLGIKRDGAMMIVSFPKGEEQSEGGQKMMIIKSGDVEGEEDSGEQPNVQIKTLHVGENSFLISELGILLEETDSGLYVLEVLPQKPFTAKNESVKGGEKLISIDNKKVQTIAEFSKIYDEIPEGDPAQIVCEKNGSQTTVKFVKEAPQTKSVIIKNQ